VLVERSGAYRGPRAAGAIALDHVSFAYERDRPALRDVSVRIEPGERVVVVGRSGAGKSTLGALVARLYDPDEGVVSIDGRDARDCSLEWLREQVGVLLQDTVLFSGTVAENIAYATDASREEIERAARVAGAHGFVSALPDGYETRLGPRGVGLSGGQQQRIGIARVLLRNPPVLVLDEPTTGLDATSEAELMDGLERLMAGRTTILVTHSDALARRAGRALVVEDGRLTADGPPADVLDRPATRSTAPLPALPALLDPERMAGVLTRSLGRDVDGVTIADARLKPGRELIVRYDVQAGERHTAVAVARARGTFRGEVGEPLVRAVEGRAPAKPALTRDHELGALIQWLPLDIALPALGLPRHDLLAQLENAGLAVAADAAGPELSPTSRSAAPSCAWTGTC
jgi:ABC-type sulfate/molybdate transport systems ATPase subunit